MLFFSRLDAEEECEEGISEGEFDDTGTVGDLDEGITEEDERILNTFLNPSRPSAQKNLTNAILSKLKDRKEGPGSRTTG